MIRISGLFFCLAISGLALGQTPPKYAFKLAPLEFYDRLDELGMGQPPTIEKEERQILEARWANASKEQPAEITDEQFLDSLIYASGVEKASEVEKLRKAYVQLLEESKQSLKPCKSETERAEKLLAFLHEGVMKEGYDADKTTFAELFEVKKYNCVSSTAIYCILGKTHGLKLQPISVPGSSFQAGHATLDLVVDGKRIQIEPTNAKGYDWEAKVKDPKAIIITSGPARSTGHDVSYWHVPAMIYSNRGNHFKKDDGSEQFAMIRCYVAALALAPDDECSTTNMTAALVNWGPALEKAEKFEQAVAAMEFAHLVAPGNTGVENNRRNAWAQHITKLLETGRDGEAMQAATNAQNTFPDESRLNSRPKWFQSLGHDLQQKAGYDAALVVMERAEKMLTPEEMKAMSEWRTSHIRLWSQSLLGEKKYAESMEVLKRFYDPKAADRELAAGIAVHMQMALPQAEAKGGLAEAISHYKAMHGAFGECAAVPEGGEQFAYRVVSELWGKKEFEKARQTLSNLAPVLDNEKEKMEIGERLYHAWISELVAAKQSDKAIERGEEGRKQFPESQYVLQDLNTAYVARIEELISGDKLNSALETAGHAAKAFASDGELKERAAWLMPYANALLRDARNEAGREAAAKYLEVITKGLSPEEREPLKEQVGEFARRWSQNRLAEKDFSGSLVALKRMKTIAATRAIDDGLAYHIQESLPVIFENQGVNGAHEHINAIREAFPMHEDAENGIGYFLRSQIKEKATKKDFMGAAKLAVELGTGAKDDSARDDLKSYAYVAWIDGLSRDKKWEEGFAKAKEALKEMPKQQEIWASGAALVDTWARESMNAKKWDEAIKIYERGLEQFPEDSILSNNLKYCKFQKEK